MLAGDNQFSKGKEEEINKWKVAGEQVCAMSWLTHEEGVLTKKMLL